MIQKTPKTVEIYKRSSFPSKRLNQKINSGVSSNCNATMKQVSLTNGFKPLKSQKLEDIYRSRWTVLASPWKRSRKSTSERDNWLDRDLANSILKKKLTFSNNIHSKSMSYLRLVKNMRTYEIDFTKIESKIGRVFR